MFIKLRWLALIVLVALTLNGLYLPLTRNLARVQAVRQVWSCVGDQPAAAFGYVWLGIHSALRTCSPLIGTNGGEDIAAISAWLSGKRVLSDQLTQLAPAWRQQLFVWRNSDWPNRTMTYSGNPGTDPALFLARLAGWAWRRDGPARGMQLGQVALSGRPTERVGDMLVRSIAPQTADEVAAFIQLRRQIAQVLPDYAFNYVDWFEVMVSYQNWSEAEGVCHELQQHVQAPYEGEAATCSARLAFYRGDYEEAYVTLLPAAKRLPENATVLTWLGLSARQLGHYAEAEEVLHQAIRYEHNSGALLNLYWQLGDCQRELKKTAEARRSYETALSYADDPKYRDQLLNLLKEVR